MDSITQQYITIAIVITALFIIIYCSKADTEKYVNYDDILNNSEQYNKYLSDLYDSDLSLKSQSTINCFDYMNSSDELNKWIDNSSKDANKRMRILGTMRTSLNHFDVTDQKSTVTMNSCYIPKQVGKTLYNIDNDAGNCTIYDVRNNKTFDLVPSKDGCVYDFSDPKLNSKDKFNEMLDTAFQVYDKENQDIIHELKKQIKNLNREIKQYKDAIRQNNNLRDYYNNETQMLNDPDGDCARKRKISQNIKKYIMHVIKEYFKAVATNTDLKRLRAEVDRASLDLDQEYNYYLQFRT